ncbi:MAG: amino acid permease [Euryarchaeota archaeon]|nr:amino acid permease [Euryarchaeota archaeon]
MGLWAECRRVLFVRRHFEEPGTGPEGGPRLRRALGLWDLVLIGIGANIGAGIFVLSGVVAKQYSGPAVSVSFLVAGLISILVALCYAEMSSMVPAAGSSYSYARVSLGEFPAWLVGWVLIMNYTLTCTAVAVGWSGYVNHLLGMAGLSVPDALNAAPGTAPGAFFNLPAFLVTLALSGLLLFGIRESAWLNRVMVVIKVVVLTLFVVVGATLVDPANLSPFAPFGFGGVMAGAAVIFFAYMGFDAHATVAEEAVEPRRNLPRAIVIALLVCTAFYMAVALVLSGLVPIGEIDTEAPLAGAFLTHGVRWASSIVAVGAWFAITNVLFVSLLAQPRIVMALSRDRLAPARLSEVHPRFRIPHVATVVMGLAVAVLAGLTPITRAAELGNIGALFVFALVCYMVVRMRRLQPDHPRTFRVPLVPLLPVVGLVSCVALMVFLQPLTWILFVFWLGLGFLVYANYGLRNR